MKPGRHSFLVGALTLISSAQIAHAATWEEYKGIRSAAMGGAHRAVGTSNDTLAGNPAGMALAKRYAVDLEYAHNNITQLNWAHLSAVDSKSSPVAAGVGYTYVHGDDESSKPGIHWLYFGVAYPITNSLAFGFSSKHIRGKYQKDTENIEFEVYTGDIGLQLRAANFLSLGLSYNNLIATDQPDLTPPTVATGVAVNLGSLLFSADVEINIEDKKNPTYSYRAGGEYFFQNSTPIRIGYSQQDYIKKSGDLARENLVSVGFGHIQHTGSLDISFVRSMERTNNWTLIGGMKFFI